MNEFHNNATNFSSLKRKRRLKIEIPNVLREISADLLKGCSGKAQGDGSVCFADCGVGVFSIKGKKKFMEDAHKIISSSNGNKGFFGVYDGHGGNKAAEFVAENLHLKIFEKLEGISENKAKEEAVKAGYLKTDEEFLKQGGYVEIHRGTWRVHGTLTVSRSIGDAHLKDWVISEPDTKVVCLTPDMQYLVLASDGLWEEVSNQEAVDVVMQSCSGGKKTRSIFSRKGKQFMSLQSASPLSKSPGASLVKSKRVFHPTCHQISTVQQKISEDDENGSPPSKSRRISMVKQLKIKTHFPDNENNYVLIKKPAYDGLLLAAAKELVNLAVARGCLDDITVMIVDLNHFRG
ncbi:hypothetical protein DH2020_049663 [Rehmannia glutinosa]|uniref:protein-serine/threonine phosphatase n=1 Tax=Rehmannia glutinosa TaxID=99300 RepID=A0ABR0U225_REHGL